MARILVLDDVLDSGIMIQKILEKKGHVVQVFHDEDEALMFTEKNHVDLAILDMNLRKMDGLDVLREMQKALPGLSAIMLTGLPDIDKARQAFVLGAVAYCAKPIDKERLEEQVAEALLMRVKPPVERGGQSREAGCVGPDRSPGPRTRQD